MTEPLATGTLGNPITLNLPDALVMRLNNLAQQLDRTADNILSEIVGQGLSIQLDELEELALVEQRAKDVREGKSAVHSFHDAQVRLGLTDTDPPC